MRAVAYVQLKQHRQCPLSRPVLVRLGRFALFRSQIRSQTVAGTKGQHVLILRSDGPRELDAYLDADSANRAESYGLPIASGRQQMPKL